MNGLSLFFLDVWTFAFSQIGIGAIGVLFAPVVMGFIKNVTPRDRSAPGAPSA